MRSLLARRVEEVAAALDGSTGDLTDVVPQSVPIRRLAALPSFRLLVLSALLVPHAHPFSYPLIADGEGVTV